MIELKPCPFCGGEAYIWVCDRLINIGCKKCDYHLSFNSYLTPEKTDVSVKYSDGTISTFEWFNGNAKNEAIEKWNRRVTVEQKHGHWIPRYNDYECSNCLAFAEFEDCEGYPMYANYEQFYDNHRYCSVCGAKMDEKCEE